MKLLSQHGHMECYIYIHNELQEHIVTCTGRGLVGLHNWHSRNIGKTQSEWKKTCASGRH